MFDSRIHGIVWGVVAVAAVFASAPLGVIVLTAVGVATLGRSLARIKQPQSAGQFVRSPLPWILLTICLLLGLAYSATPPVAFPRVAVTTHRRKPGWGLHRRGRAPACTSPACTRARGRDLDG